MRHGKKFNKLSRTHSHRRQMLANMASSLIMHKRINTTLAKAKALRLYVEPLLTKSKEDTTHSRRVVFSYLQDKHAITELFRVVAPKIADRPGGYVRILKTGTRLGDNADMAMIELVDFNESMLKEKKAAKKATTRRAGGRKKAEETSPKAEATATVEEVVEETVVEETPVVEEVVEETVVEETPVVEEVVEETVVEETPVVEPPVETPVEETPKTEEKTEE
ncbi:MAG: 50S ribosomal protein L17 [Bacteroidales bacterium]|nr:50S ribosomal protein L17 [Bacteroidales bacterium]